MSCRTLRAQRRCREVLWSTDLAPSSTDGPLPLTWTLSSPSVRDCISILAAHASANSSWAPSSLPSRLTEECYIQKIQPRLRTVKVREISEAMHVSKPYAAQVCAGRRLPHPRHWQALAEL